MRTRDALSSPARRWLGIALAVTVAGSMVALPATAFAAFAYLGGPTGPTTSLFVPNDSTPFAVQISAATTSGLPPGTVQFVKPRFSPQNKPASTLNRGSVWNRVTHQWVSEQDSDWSHFPTITVNPDGSLPTGPESWLYMNFGDDTQDNTTSNATGGWFLFISISIGVQGNTYNNTADLPEASIMTSQTSVTSTHTTSWVHNFATSGLGALAPVAATSVGSTSAVDECVRTEPNGVDDDFDGVIDNEGSQGNRTGDFRIAVPAATAFDIRTGALNQTVVNGWTNMVSGPSDTDIALGASDVTPPSAPTGLLATNSSGAAHLIWSAASDNVGVTGYHVYRWSDEPSGSVSITPPHVMVGTTSSTGYDDTSVAPDQSYHYEVRAFDAATNVGPRSATVDVADSTPPITTVAGIPATGTPAAGAVTFSLTATDTQSGVAHIRYLLDSSPTTQTYSAPIVVSGTGAHTVTFWAVDNAGNVEAPQLRSFQIAGKAATTLTIATSATSVTRGKQFTLSGLITPTPGTVGLGVHVDVKKPGKSFFSYSSNRTVYAGVGGKASWQYKYNSLKTQAKGTYVFHVVFGGNGTYLPITSRNVSVTFK